MGDFKKLAIEASKLEKSIKEFLGSDKAIDVIVDKLKTRLEQTGMTADEIMSMSTDVLTDKSLANVFGRAISDIAVAALLFFGGAVLGSTFGGMISSHLSGEELPGMGTGAAVGAAAGPVYLLKKWSPLKFLKKRSIKKAMKAALKDTLATLSEAQYTMGDVAKTFAQAIIAKLRNSDSAVKEIAEFIKKSVDESENEKKEESIRSAECCITEDLLTKWNKLAGGI